MRKLQEETINSVPEVGSTWIACRGNKDRRVVTVVAVNKFGDEHYIILAAEETGNVSTVRWTKSFARAWRFQPVTKPAVVEQADDNDNGAVRKTRNANLFRAIGPRIAGGTRPNLGTYDTYDQADAARASAVQQMRSKSSSGVDVRVGEQDAELHELRAELHELRAELRDLRAEVRELRAEVRGSRAGLTPAS